MDLKIGPDQSAWNVDKSLQEKRTAYHEWRRDHQDVIRDLYTQDVDQYEYVFIDGESVPAAVIELSQTEEYMRYPMSYVRKTEKTRNIQMKVVINLGKRLKVPVFYLIYESPITRFVAGMLYHPSMYHADLWGWPLGWRVISPPEWARTLEHIRDYAKRSRYHESYQADANEHRGVPLEAVPDAGEY